MSDKLLQESLSSWQAAEKKRTEPGFVDYLEDFTRSALFSGREFLTGQEPPLAIEKWNAQHPVSSFIAGMTMPMGAYGAFYKGTKIVKKYDDFVLGVGSAERPIAQAAAQNVVRFAPLEAGRVGLSATLGENTGEVALESAINLGIEAALGAGGAIWRAAGKEVKPLSEAFESVDPRAPVQIQMRQLDEAVRSGTLDPVDLRRAGDVLGRYDSLVRAQVADRYVHGLEGDGTGELVDKLFRPGERGELNIRRLAEGDFEKDALEEVVGAAGLAPGWTRYVQYPRVIEATGERGRQRVLNAFGTDLKQLDEGLWWAKEADEGLHVVAKKIGNDRWLTFKTDEPGRFAPNHDAWAKGMVKRTAFLRDPAEDAMSGVSIIDQLKNTKAELPLHQMAMLKSDKGVTDWVASKLGVGADRASENWRALKNTATEFLAPTMHQLKRSDRARWIWGVTRATFDKADQDANRLLYGTPKFKQGSSLYKTMIAGPEYENGIVQQIMDLGEVDRRAIMQALTDAADTIDEAAAIPGMTEKGIKVLQLLKNADEYQTGQIVSAEKFYGKSSFKAMPAHYMISRSWVGDWRTAIENEAGNTIYIAGGRSRGASQKEAEEIAARARADGKNWTVRAPELVGDRADDIEVARRIQLGDDYRVAARHRASTLTPATQPGFFRQRQDMGGALGKDKLWTNQELADIVTRHVKSQNKYIAELAVKNELMEDLSRLWAEDPGIARQLLERVGDLMGRQGAFSEWQNKAVDKVLSPVLGKNSASKLVGAVNSFMFHTSLGMGNLAFPVLNAIGFLQTTLPQTAFVLSADAKRLAKDYAYWPVAGADGRPKGLMGMLDPLRMQYRALREMGSPSADLRGSMERAITDGVIDPRFVEEYLGAQSRNITKFGQVLRGEQGITSWVSDVSSYLPALTEKFVRGHAFTVGHMIGRDYANLQGDALYNFAKDFTARTQYLYSAADRAKFINGPLGSFVGLFKNWQMHYYASMLQYLGEAKRGNFAPLLWMAGGTGAVAGVGGMPFAGLADGFSKMATNQSLMVNLYDMMGGSDRNTPQMSDAVFMGLPAFLGVSLQGSAAAPLADPARDASLMFSFVHWDRMKAVGRLAGHAIDHWEATGQHPVQSDQVRNDLIKIFAPRSIHRVAATVEEGYLRSLNSGNPQLKDLQPGERMLYQMGFMPRWVELSYRSSGELWEKQEKMKDAVQGYGQALMEARASRNYAEVQRIMVRATAQGVPLDSVWKSAESRQTRAEKPLGERQFKPQDRAVYRQAGLPG